MDTTEDRPAYLAMADGMTGPVSVIELADLQDEIDAEDERHRVAVSELRDQRNARIAYLLLYGGVQLRDLIRPTGLTKTQLSRIRDGLISGRVPASAPPGRRPTTTT